MKNIISASRRTDIPAFYIDWFIKRLEERCVYVKNPYSGKVFRVSLAPSDIHSIVFWSKDFSPLLENIEKIEARAKNLFFHFTITAVPKRIEGDTPEAKDAIRDLVFLSERYSPGHIIWRFDPLVITDRTPFSHYEEAFRRYCVLLKGRVRDCYISFAEPYRKAVSNFKRNTDEVLIDPPAEDKARFAKSLAAIAVEHGIRLSSCCNGVLLSGEVHKASCINAPRLASLFNDQGLPVTQTPTRSGCACTKSIDIGAYDSCPHGCLYCYASGDKDKALEFHRNFNTGWRGMGFDEEEG